MPTTSIYVWCLCVCVCVRCLALPRSSGLLQRTLVMKVKPRAGWSHQLVFSRVTPSDLLDSTLHMELWGQSPFSLPDRPIGVVKIEPGKLVTVCYYR